MTLLAMCRDHMFLCWVTHLMSKTCCWCGVLRWVGASLRFSACSTLGTSLPMYRDQYVCWVLQLAAMTQLKSAVDCGGTNGSHKGLRW